jgi:lipoate-protein ligase A
MSRCEKIFKIHASGRQGERHMRDPFIAFADALSRGNAHDLVCEQSVRTVQAGIDEDLVILADLARRGRAAIRLRIWRGSSCLVVPRAFARRRGFAEAKAACALPVAVRGSGGTAVVLGPHVANVSLCCVTPSNEGREIGDVFADLGRVLFPALARLGIVAAYRRVDGAYCSGTHDIAVDGRKLGGTAGLVRTMSGMRASLVHAAVSLTFDSKDLAVIRDFERRLGLKLSYRDEAATSICHEIAHETYRQAAVA